MDSEVYALLAMTACGGASVMIFDIFRAMRAAGKNGVIVTFAGDILFWISVMYMTARCLWIFNNGELRFFEAVGFAIGAVIYILLLQKMIFKILRAIFENIFKFIHLIFQILLTPPRFLYKILLVPLYAKFKNKQKMREVKGHIKNEKI